MRMYIHTHTSYSSSAGSCTKLQKRVGSRDETVQSMMQSAKAIQGMYLATRATVAKHRRPGWSQRAEKFKKFTASNSLVVDSCGEEDPGGVSRDKKKWALIAASANRRARISRRGMVHSDGVDT